MGGADKKEFRIQNEESGEPLIERPLQRQRSEGTTEPGSGRHALGQSSWCLGALVVNESSQCPIGLVKKINVLLAGHGALVSPTSGPSPRRHPGQLPPRSAGPQVDYHPDLNGRQSPQTANREESRPGHFCRGPGDPSVEFHPPSGHPCHRTGPPALGTRAGSSSV